MAKRTAARFFVAAFIKPTTSGGKVAELVTFRVTAQAHEIVIEDTIRDLIDFVGGWICGEIREFKGGPANPNCVIDLTKEMIDKHLNRIKQKAS